MKFFFSLALVFVSFSTVLAQTSSRLIPSEILSTAISNDETLLACTTEDSVYVLESSTFTILKKWAHRQETPVLIGFHPTNNNILLLQQQKTNNSLFSGGMKNYGLSAGTVLDNYRTYDRKYNELPEDSITMWDLNKLEIVNRSPGNFYFQFGTAPNSMVAISNKVYPYESQGRKLYSATRSDIKTLDGEFSFTSQINKTCRKLILGPTRKYFAVSWKDGYIGDSLFFSFSIHDFKTHEVIFKIDHLTEPMADFCFSADERLLAVSDNKEFKKTGGIRIIEISTGSTLKKIEETAGSTNLHFSANGSQIYYLDREERDWSDYDLENGIVVHKVWSKLISTNRLYFTRRIGEKLIVSGEFSIDEVGKPIGSNKKYLFRSVNMEDMKVFTKTKEENLRFLSDSTRYLMVMNDVPINNNEPVISFSNDRNYFTRVDNETQLQVWNAFARKKILQTGFEAAIRACPDKTGKYILVVENNVQRSYNEYQLHLVSMANGSMRSSSALEQGENKMNGAYYKLTIVPDPLNMNSWYCLDGSRAVWKIEGNNFSMNKVIELKEGSPSGIQFLANGTMLVLAKMKDETFCVWQSDNTGSLKQLVFNSPKSSMQSIKEGILMWNYSYSGDSSIEQWSNGIKQRTIRIHGKIRKLDALQDEKKWMVHFESGGKNYVQFFEEANEKQPVNIDMISARLYMLRSDEILAENEGFTSLLQNAGRQLPWTVRTPLLLDITNFDVSSNGNFVLLDNRIINLKDIQQWDIPQYSIAGLLQDTGKLRWVEIHWEMSYGDKTGGFTLYKFTEGNKDTVKSKTWISEPKTGDNFYFKHDQLKTSPDKKWAISFVKQGMLNKGYPMAAPMLWDLTKMVGQVIPVSGKSYSLDFSADGKRLICTSWLEEKSTGTQAFYDMFIYQVSPFKLIRSRQNITAEKLTDPGEGEQFSLQSGSIDWMQPEGNSLKVKKSFYTKQSIKKFLYSAETKKLIAGTASGNLVIWDVNGASSPIKTITAHSSPVMEMALRGTRIYTLAENGEIGITSLEQDSLKVMVRTLVKDDELRIAMSTPEGYYRVDPDLMKDLHFVKNGEVYPLSSFELQGNRPDKVYEALGLADTAFISALRDGWKNRIRKAGFDPEKDIDNNNRPLVKWDRTSLPALTLDSLLPVKFEVTSSSGDLRSVYLRINGVPAGTKRGISMPPGQKKLLVEERIPLTRGNNYISVVAVNDQGVESLEQSFDIQYEGNSNLKSRLIYIGVGVSKYADSSMNLRFAAKDINDISERLHYYFDSVELHTLTDEMATRENILLLKKYLQHSQAEDMVMISFSGHGMIEQEKGFFFAPYDMNFSKPSLLGMSMEMIDDLLDDIPARKRLLLLDACHSGEQWEGGEGTAKLPEGVTAVKPRGGVTSSTGESSGENKQLGFLLMKELFGDFSRGNGAFMISAAGSNEFAFEGEQWSNGVFTKSLLEAIRELRYKGSYGKSVPIKVRELRKLIYEKVTALTNGRQNPTSRQENGWWNWSF